VLAAEDCAGRVAAAAWFMTLAVGWPVFLMAALLAPPVQWADLKAWLEELRKLKSG